MELQQPCTQASPSFFSLAVSSIIYDASSSQVGKATIERSWGRPGYETILTIHEPQRACEYHPSEPVAPTLQLLFGALHYTRVHMAALPSNTVLSCSSLLSSSGHVFSFPDLRREPLALRLLHDWSRSQTSADARSGNETSLASGQTS